jgi:Lon protease-like protein
MVTELPLFPLNTVLFPRMVLPLHIFEERYKQMVADCLESRSPFGVALIESGEEVGGPAVPYAVGTTAEIARVERLEEGRMNLVTVGRKRFRIVDHIHTKPYIVARVEWWPLEPCEPEALEEQAQRVAALFAEYFRLQNLLAGGWRRSVGLPGDPERLADLVGWRLDVEMPRKQELLEAPTVCDRLEREAALLGEEIVSLQAQVTAQQGARWGGLGAIN